MPNIDFLAMVTAEARQEQAAAEAEAEARREAAAYLAQTDWMVVRYAETGQPMPAQVTAQRARARAIIG
jgi:hypothetical protein